jgi:structural maintenance of chromosome 1
MDAISFVLGVQSKQLRGNTLADLMYSGAGRDESQKAFVKLVFRPDPQVRAGLRWLRERERERERAKRRCGFQRYGTTPSFSPRGGLAAQGDEEVHFSRTLAANGTTAYQLDDRHCSWDQYNAKLLSYNVIVKAKNFLVFQVRVGVCGHRPAAHGTVGRQPWCVSPESILGREGPGRAETRAARRLLQN